MKRPPAVGTSVRFNDKTNNKGFKEVDGSIEIVTDAAVGPVSGVSGAIAASARQGGGLGEGNRAGYWDLKNARDITNDAARELGASRNTAISIIDLAIKHEAIKLPAAAKREEFLWTLIDKYTAKLMGKEDERSSGTASTSATTKDSTGAKAAGVAAEETTNDPETDNWS
jgi:hypothetical protein